MKKSTYAFIAILAAFTLLQTAPAMADNSLNVGAGVNVGVGMGRPIGKHMGFRGGIWGKVTAVSGNTITIAAQKGNSDVSANATYTVDASNATILKNGAQSTTSAIAVGDTLMVQGTLSGTNVVAKVIRDGKGAEDTANNNWNITGNGQPVVLGTVTAISGNSITITNKSNVTYTVDASNAKIVKGPNAIALSGIATGDTLLVQGTVNGNAVVASNIIDQAAVSNSTGGSMMNGRAKESHRGFFGGVGAFFAHLFGF